MEIGFELNRRIISSVSYLIAYSSAVFKRTTRFSFHKDRTSLLMILYETGNNRMNKAVALLLCLTTFKVQLTNGCLVRPSHVNTSCSTHCCCTLDRKNGTAAQCNIRGMNSSALDQIWLPDDLFSLDLSSSGLKGIPKFLRKFPNIRALSLANNSIFDQVSSFDELGTLKHLRTLDLSTNKKWISYSALFQYKVFSRIEKIIIKNTNFARYFNWKGLITSLPNIRQVIGVEWVKACDLCNISKVDGYQTVPEPHHYNITLRKQNKYGEVQNKIQRSSTVRMFYAKGSTADGDSGDICAFSFFSRFLILKWETYYLSPGKFLSPGFMLQCYCGSRDCVHVKNEKFKSIPNIISLLRHLFNSLCFTGTVAIILNLATVVVVSTSEILRKVPTMILILNLAVCDLLMSIYCILTALYFKLLTSEYNFQKGLVFPNIIFTFKRLEVLCRSKLFIFTVTQNVSVLTSLLVTAEKYLVIVYPMDPGRRMTKTLCLIFLCAAWFVSIAYSVDAVFNLDKEVETYNNEMFNYFYCSASGRHIHQVPISARGKMSMPSSVFIGVLYGFLFLCTVPLYIHIYIVVKRSSTQMGVKREGVLARKLALLVFTNLIFCVVPLSLAPLLSSNTLLTLDIFKPLTRTYGSYQAYLIGFVWLPVLLLSLNCCLNPLIFAFRYHRFKTELRKMFSNVINRFGNIVNLITTNQK